MLVHQELVTILKVPVFKVELLELILVVEVVLEHIIVHQVFNQVQKVVMVDLV
jgi:hypothetical protein